MKNVSIVVQSQQIPVIHFHLIFKKCMVMWHVGGVKTKAVIGMVQFQTEFCLSLNRSFRVAYYLNKII